MTTGHSLHGPEVAIFLAALGLILNACITFYISHRHSSPRPANSHSVRAKRGQRQPEIL
ncbi:MAG: hypothetical protein ACKN9T_14755 [Candidatus Methylumidiphilus sp.]